MLLIAEVLFGEFWKPILTWGTAVSAVATQAGRLCSITGLTTCPKNLKFAIDRFLAFI